MTLDSVRSILACVSYRDSAGRSWRFDVRGATGGCEMRVNFHAEPTYVSSSVAIGEPLEEQHGRWLRISQHATKSEVVHTALLAVLVAEEHEQRERFRYMGRAIFGPHFDVDRLAAMAGKLDNLDIRDAA